MTLSELEQLINKKWAACGRCGDEYYRAVTDALVSRKMALTPECRHLRAAYDTSLKDYLACVELLPAKSPERSELIKRALSYRSLLISHEAVISSGSQTKHNLSAASDNSDNSISSPASGRLDAPGLKG